MKILKLLILALCLALPARAETGTSADTGETAAPVAAVGQPAPDFALMDTKGESHSLGHFKGKTVVLEWTNHECPFVKKHYETGNMQALQKEAAGQNVVWLTINSSAPGAQGHTTPEQAEAIIAETGAAATARLFDPEGIVGRKYGAMTTPHMYIIDSQGILVYAGAIDNNPSADHETVKTATNYIRAALQNLAAGQPVETAQTKPYGCAVKYKES